MRTQKQRMLAGELYLANDPELLADHARAQVIVADFNATRADDVTKLVRLLRSLFGRLGDETVLKPNFRCDYGFNIAIGARTFVNYDCVFLDCNVIMIGDDVQIAPGVTSILRPTHSTRPRGDPVSNTRLPLPLRTGFGLEGDLSSAPA